MMSQLLAVSALLSCWSISCFLWLHH